MLFVVVIVVALAWQGRSHRMEATFSLAVDLPWAVLPWYPWPGPVIDYLTVMARVPPARDGCPGEGGELLALMMAVNHHRASLVQEGCQGLFPRSGVISIIMH